MATNARQVYDELPVGVDANAKVQQVYDEIPVGIVTDARVQQVYDEVPAGLVTDARVQQVYVEVLVSVVKSFAYPEGVGANGVIGVLPMAAGRVALRWSDDGGHTWSDYYERSLGDTGEYGTRVRWQRLGMTMQLRDRVYELSGTDATKITIMGAELHVQPTNA